MQYPKAKFNLLYAGGFLVASVVVASCDGRETLFGPKPTNPRPAVTTTSMIASTIVPVPTTTAATDGPYVGLGDVPDSGWVIITATSDYTATWNPACNTAPPYWPCPAGDPAPQLNIWVDVGGGRRDLIDMRISGSGGLIGLQYRRSPGTLVAHTTVSNLWAWDPSFGHGPYSYDLTGGFTVTALSVPSPLQITAGNPDSTGARTYTVAPLYGLQLDQPVYVGWEFVPGDSVSQYAAGSEAVWELWDCYGEGRTTCRWAPPPGVNGRMQAWTYANGQYVWTRSEYVLSSGRCTATPGLLGNKSARYSISGSGCDQEPHVKLSCDKTSVERGSAINCRADAVPAGTALTNISWTYDDSTHNTIKGPATPEWGGIIVVPGEIKVLASLGARSDSDSVSISVTHRQWPAIRLTVHEAGHGDLPPVTAVDSVGKLAHTHFDVISPSNVSITLLESGPNTGWAYFSQPVTSLPLVVHLSDALKPGSAFMKLQHYGLTGNTDMNGNPTYYCTQSQVLAMIPSIREHEGSLHGSLHSHVDEYRDWFKQNSAQDSVEKMMFYDPDPGAAQSFLLNSVLAQFEDEATHEPGQGHRAPTIPGGTVDMPVWPCAMRFFP